MSSNTSQILSITNSIEKIITDLIYIFEELKTGNNQINKKNIHTLFTLKRKLLSINERILEINTRINTLLLTKKEKNIPKELEDDEIVNVEETIQKMLEIGTKNRTIDTF